MKGEEQSGHKRRLKATGSRHTALGCTFGLRSPPKILMQWQTHSTGASALSPTIWMIFS